MSEEASFNANFHKLKTYKEPKLIKEAFFNVNSHKSRIYKAGLNLLTPIIESFLVHKKKTIYHQTTHKKNLTDVELKVSVLTKKESNKSAIGQK
jgi:hypothetical protein